MAKKITNEVLAEKIDNLNNTFASYRNEHKETHCAIETELNENTAFRQKAYGVIGLLTIGAGAITAFGMWVLNKVWK